MKNQGFTLIELMIVVAIIAIIAAIAIPSLMRARIAANETSAVEGLRIISEAQIVFHVQAMRVDPGTGAALYGSLSDLGTALPPFIDKVLESGTKSGYTYDIAVIDDPPAYEATAEPASFPRSGVRHFFVNDEGVIRFTNDGSSATAASPPIN